MLEPLVTPQTLEKHPVSELQELCQRMRKRVEYKYHTSKLSDDEEEMKAVEVFINDKEFGRGVCTKKEVAKRRAARSTLERLKIKGEESAD